MHPSWKDTSEIARILETQRTLRTRGLVGSPEDSSYGTAQVRNLETTIADLHRSRESLHPVPEFYDSITELIGFMKQVQNEVPLQQKVAFPRLQSLRAWIFWLPTKLLRGGEGDWGALTVLSQFYTAALVLEPFFPGLEGSYLEERHCSLLFRYEKCNDQEAALRFAGECADQINGACKSMKIHAVPIKNAVLIHTDRTSPW